MFRAFAERAIDWAKDNPETAAVVVVLAVVVVAMILK
jgi:hypothetical protein